ncbi:MAG: type II toxin-antitoxin system PemK/MazF family toxin [Firmicutes bacterium]|nr:type II toxin-antitoxin system PemK/MazF family toxin [Bacillota bacterium]
MACRRGDIFYANLNPVIGSEQGGLRPVLIVQNDLGNRFSPTTIVAAITSRTGKHRLPTHLELPAARYRLDRDSVALLEQLRTIDKRRLKNRIGRLDEEGLARLERALRASLGLK